MSSKLAVFTSPDRIRGLLQKHILAGKCTFWLGLSLSYSSEERSSLLQPVTLLKDENKSTQTEGWMGMNERPERFAWDEARSRLPLSQELIQASLTAQLGPKTSGRRWRLPGFRITWFSHKNLPGYRAAPRDLSLIRLAESNLRDGDCEVEG